jgi:magnesium transporter
LHPDWIAHGILDTIVDDFFPLLSSIEQEVKDLDDLVLSIDGQATKEGAPSGNKAPLEFELNLNEKKLELFPMEVKEKMQTESSGSDNTPMLVKPLGRRGVLSWLPTSVRRIVKASPVWDLKQWTRSNRSQQVSSSPSPLRRMASTRRLVTSLTRLLGTKSEVVSQIRKRLTGGAMMGLNMGPFEQVLAAEVSIYLGDIQGLSRGFSP